MGFVPVDPDGQRIGDNGAAELTPGAVLRGRYVLEEVIGRGGHSLVFRAKDLHRATALDPDGGRVALKALKPIFRTNTRAVERLAREFRQMQRLSHPNITRVFDLDCDGDIWFLTMELVSGCTVAQWLRTAPPAGDAIEVIGRCAHALQYAHSMGVIHGDIKPSNILVTPDRQVSLIDFGAVPSAGDHVNYTTATPSYASPQVLAGMSAEGRDDVFSLACVSYEVLSGGQRPFGNQSSLDAHRARLCPAAISGVPVEVFAALVASLAGDREQRAASPEIFYRDLSGNAASMTRPRDRGARVTVRRTGLAGLGLAAAAACAVVLLSPAARSLVAGDAEVARVAPAPAEPAASAPVPQGTGQGAGDGITALVLDAVSNSAAAADAVGADAAAAAPRAPGLVTFENAALVASSAQPLIAIPVKRLKSTHGVAAVEWQVEHGGPSVDYKSMQSQVVRFSDGEAVRSIFIPLRANVGNAGSSRTPHSFSVTLRQVEGGVRLGAVTRVNVTIVPQPSLSSDLNSKVAAAFTP